MVNKRVLLISGSSGLGHLTCDLAIADGLKCRNAQVPVDWLAAPPASQMIQHAGEHMLGASNQWVNDTVHAEETARGTRLNLMRYMTRESRQWERNATVYQVLRSGAYDCVIGDESYKRQLPWKRRRRH
jgi:hypothetical protein